MHLQQIVDQLKEADTWLFLKINGLHNPPLDKLMHWASLKYFWIPLYAVFLFLVIKQYKKNTFLILIFAALTIALSDQICLHFFKNVFQRYRPCHNLLLAAKIHLVDACGGKYGFVSSHAANTFALAYFLLTFFVSKYSWSWALFIWAGVVSYSRIYLGQHYPADVLIGACVGLLSAFLTTKLYFYAHQKRKHA